MKRTKFSITETENGDYYSAEYADYPDTFVFDWYRGAPYIHIFPNGSSMAWDVINVYDYEQGTPRIDNKDGFIQAIEDWFKYQEEESAL